MKSKKIIAALLAATVVASVSLVGCGKSDAPASSGQASGGADKEQYLNLFLKSEPKTLDISKATDMYSAQAFLDTMEGLTRVEKENGKDVVKPAMAESWTTSKDGLVWTFKLRDANWSDGKKVSAKDFEYSVKRTLNPATAAQYAYFLFVIKGAEDYNTGKGSADAVGIKAVDDKTLEITLKEPCGYFLDLTRFKTMLPQRQDIVEKNGAKYGTEASTLIFNGPYIMKDWVHQNKIELEKNDKYWDAGKVKIQKATFKIIKDENAKMNELLNGSLDVGGARKTEWIDKFKKSGKFDLLEGYDGSTTYFKFNTKEKVFSNAKVRQAFSLAATRDDAVKTLYKNLGTPAYGWVPMGINIGNDEYRGKVGSEPLKELAEKNKDPKALLVDGLKELGMDPDPSKVEITITGTGTDAQEKEYDEYFQQMFEKGLGIKVKVDYMEWPVAQKKVQDYQYQIIGEAWGEDYNDPMTFMDMWESKAQAQVCNGWMNKDYDALIDKSRKATTQQERMEAFKAAEKLLVADQAVIIPMNYRKYATFQSKFVKNLMVVDFGNLYELKYAYTDGRGK